MEVSIYELLAAARESAKSDYIKGDSILCEKRFHPDTHYMVEMELLGNSALQHRLHMDCSIKYSSLYYSLPLGLEMQSLRLLHLLME